MSSLAIACVMFGCVLVSTLAAMLVARRLPEQHLSGESRDVVKLGLGVIGTMTALVLLAGTELLAARLVNAPRPSATQWHLAQDDALRAQSLRALYHSATGLGLATGLSMLLLLEPALRGHWPQDPVQGVWNGAAMTCAALMVAFLSAAAFSMPGGRFHQRLWPRSGPLANGPGRS